jgi:DNA-binding CsgD family transcriptional regulator
MSITLSASELSQIAHVSTVMLAPGRASSLDAWRAQVNRVVSQLLDIETIGFVLPAAGTAPIICAPALDLAASEWIAYYHTLDRGMAAPTRGTPRVFHTEDFYPPGRAQATEFFQDWIRPHRLADALSVVTPATATQSSASLHVYNQGRRADFRERARMLLELLAPAFVAGVAAAYRQAEQGRDLAAVIEHVGDGALLARSDGTVIFRSARLGRLLDAADDGGALARAIEASVRAACAVIGETRGKARGESARPNRELSYTVRAGVGTVTISALVLGSAATAMDPAIMVVVECSRSEVPTRAVLRERWALTDRQALVAEHLLGSASVPEIARKLGLSPHTVHHHAEQIYARLEVRSRLALREAVLAPRPPEVGD